jgi:hypothetical protein
MTQIMIKAMRTEFLGKVKEAYLFNECVTYALGDKSQICHLKLSLR